ncbi:MAG: disulfide bond formation protein B [Candidatus Competibacteraceae bacterium]|nr:disulfide bond formation protein B [Candidatus Competibacteraceae bacterium]
MNTTLMPSTAAFIVRGFNLIALVGITLLLLVALFDQFVLGELPCPLCLLQRVAFIMVGMGFLLNVRCGTAPLHYGLVILSALAGAFASGRQILLHIVPGTGAYGSALFGLHFYTWAFVAFMLTLLGVGLILLVETRVGEARPATAGGRIGQWVGLLLAGVVRGLTIMIVRPHVATRPSMASCTKNVDLGFQAFTQAQIIHTDLEPASGSLIKV